MRIGRYRVTLSFGWSVMVRRARTRLGTHGCVVYIAILPLILVKIERRTVDALWKLQQEVFTTAPTDDLLAWQESAIRIET
jgi:hypothetical protein